MSHVGEFWFTAETNFSPKKLRTRVRYANDTLKYLPPVPGVYMLIHAVTGDTYIGSSQNIRFRVQSHRVDLRLGSSCCQALATLAETNLINFRVTVLELCGAADMYAREAHWIKKLEPTLNLNAPRGQSERRA